MRLGTQEMLGVLEVKGDATEASSSDREMPPWALFSAWLSKRLKYHRSLQLCTIFWKMKSIYDMKASTYSTVISSISTHPHIIAVSTTEKNISLKYHNLLIKGK